MQDSSLEKIAESTKQTLINQGIIVNSEIIIMPYQDKGKVSFNNINEAPQLREIISPSSTVASNAYFKQAVIDHLVAHNKY